MHASIHSVKREAMGKRFLMFVRRSFSFVCVAAVLALALAPLDAQAQAQPVYHVKPGDILEISVWKEPDLQRTVLVRPDGAFSFPLVGEIDARGKTVADLSKIVSERVSRYIADAVVTVSLQEVKGNKIFVIGQVNKPGEFIVNPSVNVMQALSMAGGLTPFASANDIKILRRNGTTQQALPFQYGDVVRGRSLNQNIELMSGDVVVVP
ncbi:MAG TPA: polysaccharide biosynthesis/export family protein [Steroidobacteraceae bacterium]